MNNADQAEKTIRNAIVSLKVEVATMVKKLPRNTYTCNNELLIPDNLKEEIEELVKLRESKTQLESEIEELHRDKSSVKAKLKSLETELESVAASNKEKMEEKLEGKCGAEDPNNNDGMKSNSNRRLYNSKNEWSGAKRINGNRKQKFDELGKSGPVLNAKESANDSSTAVNKQNEQMLDTLRVQNSNLIEAIKSLNNKYVDCVRNFDDQMDAIKDAHERQVLIYEKKIATLQMKTVK